MPKGGLRVGKDGTTNHLFSSKWRLGKTTAIRIPAILKDKFLSLAKYLDNKSAKQLESLDIVEQLKNNEKLNSQAFIYHNEAVILNKKIDILESTNEDLRKRLDEVSNLNRYQTAIECFAEYLDSQNLNVQNLSKSRKGTKKYQLFEINEWFKQWLES